MLPMRPSARRIARKLLLLPILVVALLVTIVPAPASGPWDSNQGNGSWGVDYHKPAGNGDGRKFK